MMKSEIKKIITTRRDHNFDKAFESAYDQALCMFGIDEDSHCEDRDNFSRSESSLIVEFVKCAHHGGMGGQVIIYEHICYMEKN